MAIYVIDTISEENSDSSILKQILSLRVNTKNKNSDLTNLAPYITNHQYLILLSAYLFISRCGIIMRPHRHLMVPSTLERLLILSFNKDLWNETEKGVVMARSYGSEVVVNS